MFLLSQHNFFAFFELYIQFLNFHAMKKILFFAATLLMLAGCSVYHPQAVDIPLINHAGDGRIDASVGMSTFILPDAVTINATVSYGLNSWLAGQVHFNHGGDNYYGQIAPGFYHPLGAKSVVECYAGFGYGGASRENIDPDNSSNASNKYSFEGHYRLPFVQGNIGWHDLTGARFDLAFGLKVGGFLPDYNYHEFDNNGDEIPAERLDYTTTNLLVEPQVVLRVGSPKLKFNVKAGYAWLSDMKDSPYKFIYDNLTISTGLTFVF